MASVRKSDFRKPLRHNIEKYLLPEYGEEAYVMIQALTSRDIVAMQDAYGGNPDSANLDFVHELMFRCLTDDSGRRLFESPAEVSQTIDLSLPALEDLIENCLRVSGISSKRTEGKN